MFSHFELAQLIFFTGTKGSYMNNKWTVTMNYKCELMEADRVELDVSSEKCPDIK